jgi:hypothetical protein
LGSKRQLGNTIATHNEHFQRLTKTTLGE